MSAATASVDGVDATAPSDGVAETSTEASDTPTAPPSETTTTPRETTTETPGFGVLVTVVALVLGALALRRRD